MRDRAIALLDFNRTPTDKSDDSWTFFEEADGVPSLLSWSDFGFEADGGIWYQGTYWNIAGTAGTKSDDQWCDVSAAANITGMIIDANGNKWLRYADSSTEFESFGLKFLDDTGTPLDPADDAVQTFYETDGLCGRRGYAITQDLFGDKWIGGTGVCRLDDKGTPLDKADDRWDTFTSEDGLASNGVVALATDSRGAVWIATSTGLSYFYYDR